MRTETEVRAALALLTEAAVAAAMKPKNAEKGPWRRLTDRALLALLLEEAGEVARAITHGESLDDLRAEIGDAGFVLAMLLDNSVRIDETVRALQDNSVKAPVVQNSEALVWPAIYDETPKPGCHLELKLLGANDTCGACGYAAAQHRNWKGNTR